jgi:hypothetical protein
MDVGFWFSVGKLLGGGYLAYGFALLLGCWGFHAVLCGAYIWSRRQGARLVPLELVYGLLNPLVYLLVFQPALFRAATPVALAVLEWLLLGGYWTWRVLGRPAFLRLRLVGGDELLLAAISCLLALVGARDLVISLPQPGAWDVGLLGVGILSVAPLYVLPLVVAVWDWADAHAGSRPGIRSPRLVRVATALILASLVLFLLGNVRMPAGLVRQRLLAVRPTILTISEQHRIDPRFLAALLFVVQREQGSPVRAGFEELLAGLWETDSLLAAALDPPLGISQARPIAVQTALAIHWRSTGQEGFPGKAYRQVSWPTVERTASPGLAHVSAPLNPSWLPKNEVVHALLVPERNLHLAAFVLDMLATDWDVHASGVHIRSRPDLLATVYQFGFDRSRPHPDPQPSDFGREVQAAYDDHWIAEHFAAPRR